jgi:hypothetical protein
VESFFGQFDYGQVNVAKQFDEDFHTPAIHYMPLLAERAPSSFLVRPETGLCVLWIPRSHHPALSIELDVLIFVSRAAET